MPHIGLTSKMRRELILIECVKLASVPGGWNTLTLARVAKQCQCTHGLISHHYGSIAELRRKVVRVAVKEENFAILAQALTAGDPDAKRIHSSLKQKVFAHLAGA